jgi:RimJ/RimL family protein N-acetyltransferase
VNLREHDVILRGDRIVLRPMTEDDWDILLKWNSDPEVLYYCDCVTSWDLEPMQGMYREVSQSAFCFIIEFEDRPIGECSLQRMNLDRVLFRYPGKDCRRIDLMIGEKHLWGQGLGTDVICTLTRFGFEAQAADLIFGCGIADYNLRSQRAFWKVGYRVDAKTEMGPGQKAQYEMDMVMDGEAWRQVPRGCSQGGAR